MYNYTHIVSCTTLVVLLVRVPVGKIVGMLRIPSNVDPTCSYSCMVYIHTCISALDLYNEAILLIAYHIQTSNCSLIRRPFFCSQSQVNKIREELEEQRKKEGSKTLKKVEPVLLSRVTVNKWQTSENERGQSLAGRGLAGQQSCSMPRLSPKSCTIRDSRPVKSRHHRQATSRPTCRSKFSSVFPRVQNRPT